jgi:hypothetical protein
MVVCRRHVIVRTVAKLDPDILMVVPLLVQNRRIVDAMPRKPCPVISLLNPMRLYRQSLRALVVVHRTIVDTFSRKIRKGRDATGRR